MIEGNIAVSSVNVPKCWNNFFVNKLGNKVILVIYDYSCCFFTIALLPHHMQAFHLIYLAGIFLVNFLLHWLKYHLMAFSLCVTLVFFILMFLKVINVLKIKTKQNLQHNPPSCCVFFSYLFSVWWHQLLFAVVCHPK